MDEFFKANKEMWEAYVDIHESSEFYDLKGFLEGKQTLNPIEIEEIGDVKGKSLLHLQCHFGLDTVHFFLDTLGHQSDVLPGTALGTTL